MELKLKLIHISAVEQNEINSFGVSEYQTLCTGTVLCAASRLAGVIKLYRPENFIEKFKFSFIQECNITTTLANSGSDFR